MTDDSIKQLFVPSPMSYYRTLTNGSECRVRLSQDEAAVTLKAHDYGVSALTGDEAQLLDVVIGKLKDQIHP